MESKHFFGRYTLSQSTLDKLQEFDGLLERDLYPANPAWSIIKPQEAKEHGAEDEEPPMFPNIDVAEKTDDYRLQSVPSSSTQFFYSQRETSRNAPVSVEPVDSQWSDVAESLYESLENTNETLALVNLQSLSDKEVDGVVKYLSNKLSLKGTYNLCHSVCAMDMDQSMIYIRIICRHLLLQKIIDLEEPSRLINSVIHELVEVFPEDIQEFVYIPILNAELRDTTVVTTMINSFDPHRRSDLITSFLATVNELKEWHLVVLSQLINAKLPDNSMKEKLLNLLLEKASTFSRNKNYGKFVVSYAKLNTPFTEEQKSSLNEIVAVNETIFKRVTENLLKNMYLFGDMWHIS